MLLLMEEINLTITAASAIPELSPKADKLAEALGTLQNVTAALFKVAGEKGPEIFLADATLYIEMFGVIAIAWQWLLQGLKAKEALAGNPSKADLNFYQGKLFTLRFFFEYELPKIEGLAVRLMSSDAVTVEMETAFFDD